MKKHYINLIILLLAIQFCAIGQTKTQKKTEAEPKLEFLKTWDGKSAIDVLKNNELKIRLSKLMGKDFKNFETILNNSKATGKLKNNLFSIEACDNKNCKSAKIILVADILKNDLETGIWFAGKGQTFQEIVGQPPVEILDWVRKW